MIQFAPWNIVISYSLTRKERLKPSERSSEKAYEERVRLALNYIGKSATGKALFQSTMGKEPIYIVPYVVEDDYCNSRTGPFYSEKLPSYQWEYEGVKLEYAPDRWSVDDCGWYPGARAEEVLFHELVHASRQLNNAVSSNTPLHLMGDYEEFFAVLVTNMYRTELGATKIHREYVLKELVTVREAEAFLSSRREYLQAIEFFMDEPLVEKLKNVSTPFHPFRDFERIKAGYSMWNELWDDVNLVGQAYERERIRKLGEKLEEMRIMSVESSAKKIKH